MRRPVPDAARRRWAWVALAALATLVVALLVMVVRSNAKLLGFLLAAAAFAALGVTASWWAITTRKGWKRGLYLAAAVTLALLLGAEVVTFSLARAGAVLAISVSAFVYAASARRALAGDRLAAGGTFAAIDPPARPWLLVNPRSGGGTAERTGLVGEAQSRGVTVHVLQPGDDPATLARKAVAEGAGVIGVAGGDGSLGLVAAVAIAVDVPFVCVPAGTRNHFAHDLGLDRTDPVGALAAFSGLERRIDAAHVGDRVFLNNVSLGAYADVVAEPRYRNRKLDTARVVVRRAARAERAPLDVSFCDPAGRRFEDVQLLQVANNAYQIRRPSALGARERLDGGVLQVSAVRARTGAALAAMVGRVAVGADGKADSWAQWESPTLTVTSPRAELPAGVDGEATLLATPLEFGVLPQALRVLVPPTAGSQPIGLGALRRATVRRLWRIALGGA